jgi:ABC-type branched-subunit amino acid transport system ATPase component
VTTAEVASAAASTTGPNATAAMAARRITVRFGGLTALSEVSIEVQPGEIAGLVGPNGAGKSTLLAVLSGLQRQLDTLHTKLSSNMLGLVPTSRWRR